MKKVIKKIISLFKIILLTLTFLIIVLVFCSKITYKPITYLTNKLFDSSKKEVAYPRIENFDELLFKVEVNRDLEYKSEYENNKLDLIIPKNKDDIPVIFWIHGGAYVGGDKRDTLDYLISIASYGYAIVNINYELAPKTTYPTPIKQISEAFKFIESIAPNYNIDLNNIFIGGDSVGAQIAGQFTNIQMNKEYSNKVNIDPCIKSENIRGFISFSGLLNLKEFNKTDSKLSNKLFYHAAWAYFKDKDWENNPLVKEASITGNIEEFPPTFLTDGNINSFENQAKDLYSELKNLNIPVKINVYEKDKVKLGHEYQFNMDLIEARENFDMVIEFLNEYKD
ncbi:alpha/beta hydrolase [Clostridium sp.]|uniref:alpha/beta hydrolase n=1 Tax=Clostridium sp. TaxID=1506 RepID=UPI0025C04311|nr:alpha/beta hydrolase [Clostridium sp.]